MLAISTCVYRSCSPHFASTRKMQQQLRALSQKVKIGDHCQVMLHRRSELTHLLSEQISTLKSLGIPGNMFSGNVVPQVFTAKDV